MRENTYDRDSFFLKYGEMLRSKEGLDGAGEWPVLKKLLPDFEGKRVLDLGCGYGWHCVYAAHHGASFVLGIDLSHKMIRTALERNRHEAIEYQVSGIEDFEFPEASYDVIISSLTLHYIEDLQSVFQKIEKALVSGGSFVFTIEHPVFTAQGAQDWYYDKEQIPLHWPVDNYYLEGKRVANFLGEEVVKFHHTLTSILQGLLRCGFIINDIIEPQPTSEMIETIPGMKDELRRPMMLAISVLKK